MNQKKQLTIKEFSRLTGIKRENLRYYDRIGLLSPEARGENNYRYYSRRQLNTAYLISSLRGLGVGIEDIKKYSAQRSPENTLALLAQQEARIQSEIRQLNETSLIMQMYSDMVHEALEHADEALFLEEKECESIFLCPPIPEDMDSDEGGIFSYDYAEANGVNLGFPQGTLIAKKYLEMKDASVVDRYYFRMGDSNSNGCKPAGLYAVAYGRCDPWKSEALYLRLLEFIKDQGLYICGDAYEEYPLGDVVAEDINRQLLRVEIPVKRESDTLKKP